MKHPEHAAKTPSPRTGLSATLPAFLSGAKGSGAPSFRLAALFGLALAASLALAAPALASTHIFGTSFGAATNPSPTPPNPYPLSEPVSVAVDNSSGPSSGDSYVTDPANFLVEKFTPAGAFILMFGKEVNKTAVENSRTAEENVCPAPGHPADECQPGTSASTPGAFETPTFLAVDSSISSSAGDIYVADTAANLITKFGPDGSLIESWGKEGQLAGSSATGTGNLETGSTLVEALVTETGAFSVGQEISAPGIPAATTIVAASGGSLEISQPASASETAPLSARHSFGSIAGIAIDSSGNLIVREGATFLKFTSAGGFATTFNSGFGTSPVGIAVDSTGNIYLVRPSGAVAEVSSAGATLHEEVDPGPTTGLAVDPSNADLYVDRGTEIVRRDASGTRLESFGSSADLTAGAGLAVDFASAIYVADTAAAHVAVFTLLGPSAVIGPATGITDSTATLNGRVTPTGGGVITNCGFEYVTEDAFTAGIYSEANTVPCSPVAPLSSSTLVSAALPDLNGGTTYHFRLLATDSNATNVSPELTFTTLGPSVEASSASHVSATSATLETEINPKGLPTTYHFEYDTAPYTEGEGPHGIDTPEASAGSGISVSAHSVLIGPLAPSTIYHFRVVAESPLGTDQGPDRAFTTQGSTASNLADGRVWEMVSPPSKEGTPLEAISEEGGLIQAAADGESLAYFAKGAIDSQPSGNRSAANSQLLAHHAGAGLWTTEDLATPNQAVSGLHTGNPSEYKLFSEDLSLAALEPFGGTPLSPSTSERSPYLRQPDGEYSPLVVGCPAEPQPCPQPVSEHANVPSGTIFGGEETRPEFFGGGVKFITATPDLSHILLASSDRLTPGSGGPSQEGSIYEWSDGTLRFVSLIPPGLDTACGGAGPACIPNAEVASANVGNGNLQVRHAISGDGSRSVFTVQSSLYLRDMARAETVQLDAAELGCGSCEGGGGIFQDASVDGSKVFFTDQRKLTIDSAASSTGGGASGTDPRPDLYMCQIEDSAGHLDCALKDLTVDHNSGESAAVQGDVIGASSDGSDVYFVANGRLTSDSVAGNCRIATTSGEVEEGLGVCNLYRYDTTAERPQLIAVLSGKDLFDWFAGSRSSGGENLGELTARVSPNGRFLAFMSQRSLTGYDNRDLNTGQFDQEVYLFDAEAPQGHQLVCASCNPTGGRPRGIFVESSGVAVYGRYPGLLVNRPRLWGGQTLAASIPGWTIAPSAQSALYQSRYLSNSGRLFFNAADALVPQDSNGVEDVYQYEPPQGVGQPASDTCTTSSSTFSSASVGCVSLISSGASPEESAFIDASESGNDVFFLTASKLVPRDVDNALDIYDAKVDGHAVESPTAIECAGDACQQPATPPNDATPGSLTFNGAGNLLQCPKGKIKQKGKCVKKKAKKQKKHHKKTKKAKPSSAADQRKKGHQKRLAVFEKKTWIPELGLLETGHNSGGAK